jgi:hypothetical protein
LTAETRTDFLVWCGSTDRTDLEGNELPADIDQAGELHIVRSLCRGCGAPIDSESICPICGFDVANDPADGFKLSVVVSVHFCTECGVASSVDAESCYACSAILEPAEDPEATGITKVRLDQLSTFLGAIERLLEAADSQPAAVAVTGEQLIEFILHHELVSTVWSDKIEAATAVLDLETEAGLMSEPTAAGVRSITTGTRELVAVRDQLVRMSVPLSFTQLHALLIALCDGQFGIVRAIAMALRASTVEGLAAAQFALQAALDRSAGTATELGLALSDLDPALAAGSIDERLSRFTGVSGVYEHRSRPDLAASLIELAERSDSAEHRLEVVRSYFGTTLAMDPSVLPEESLTLLYLIAATLSARPNPGTVLLRLGALSSVLLDAFDADPESMATACTEASKHDEGAFLNLLALGDQLLALDSDNMSDESTRLTLANSYSTLVEWIYGRLVNLILVARSILAGKRKTYQEISTRQFGDKFHVLDQEQDPRYVTAMAGVARVIRNAGAHGDVDISADPIRFRHADPRSGNVSEVSLTEEEFARTLDDLFLTCVALAISTQLLRIKHSDRIAPEELPTAQRLRIESAQILAGMWGLRKVEIRIDEEKSQAAVQASTAKDPLPISKFFSAAATTAALFPTLSSLRLSVQSDDASGTLQIDVADAVGAREAPESFRPYQLIKMMYGATLSPPEYGSQEDRFVRLWLFGLAALLATEITEFIELGRRLPGSQQHYRLAAEQLSARRSELSDLLQQVPPETCEQSDALKELEAGVSKLPTDPRVARARLQTARKQLRPLVELWRPTRPLMGS